MLARYAGAILGLFAFAIVIITGLLAQNPIAVTLSRALFALFLFLLIGFLLGGAAQLVVNEHQGDSNAEIERRYHAARSTRDNARGGEPQPNTEGRAASG